MTPSDVIGLAKENKVELVDMKFVDLLGTWQHFSVPISELDESTFEDGLGFDGSSIRGWKAINMSDMLIIPQPETARIDPFITTVPTLSLVANIADPIDKSPYSRDPRNIAKHAEAYLKSTGIGETIFFGPEPEFFIFDDVRFDTSPSESFYSIDSEEGAWNSGADLAPNLGHRPRHKGGYFPVSPVDSVQPLRIEMMLQMQRVGLHVECEHHEVATAGQCEIDIKFAPLTACADNVMWLKHVVKNVAARHGKTATFMPKPVFADNGSGMHCHQSIWKDGKPLFAGDGYAGMSQMAMHYIAGILKHARALCAFTNPSTNSYKRLVPGYEAPVNLAYSSRNRSASVRIPMYSASPKAKRIEVRFPDASANPYLAFAAMAMAGIDGIVNKLEPGDPLDKDIYGMSPEELADVPSAPGSLADAMTALEEDHEFLLKGDVFSRDLIETWIAYKRENEVDELRLRPHPHEFSMYYDC